MDAPRQSRGLSNLIPEAAPPGCNENDGSLLNLVLRAIPADKYQTVYVASRGLAIAASNLTPEQCGLPQISYQRALEQGHAPALRRFWTGPEAAGYLGEQIQRTDESLECNTTTTILAANGHLGALAWARALSYAMGLPWDPNIYRWAAHNGHLPVIQWAQENGCPDQGDLCRRAVAGGDHVHILRWARSQTPPHPWTGAGGVLLSQHAASYGRLKCLDWALQNGCPGYRYLCESAASGGSLESLKWLRDHQYQWYDTWITAAWNGHLHIIKWAAEAGCPWDPEDSDLVGLDQEDIIQWIDENSHAAKRPRHDH